MSPENVTRASKEYASLHAIAENDINPIAHLSSFMRTQHAFIAGASWSREQHREVLIRLKHILERGIACEVYEDCQRAALAVIQKELAP